MGEGGGQGIKPPHDWKPPITLWNSMKLMTIVEIRWFPWKTHGLVGKAQPWVRKKKMWIISNYPMIASGDFQWTMQSIIKSASYLSSIWNAEEWKALGGEKETKLLQDAIKRVGGLHAGDPGSLDWYFCGEEEGRRKNKRKISRRRKTEKSVDGRTDGQESKVL